MTYAIILQMGVVGEEKSYEILCKTFDHEAKAVLEVICFIIDMQLCTFVVSNKNSTTIEPSFEQRLGVKNMEVCVVFQKI